MGDANAKVGKIQVTSETCGVYGLGEGNERGERLIEFCSVNELMITNTLFEQHPGISPDNSMRNQIDYIMVGKRWRSSIIKVRTYPGADCYSDHQLSAMSIKLRVQRIKRQQTPMWFDVQKLDNEYRINVNNRFQGMLDIDQEKSPNELWLEAKEAVLEVAKNELPRAKRREMKEETR